MLSPLRKVYKLNFFWAKARIINHLTYPDLKVGAIDY